MADSDGKKEENMERHGDYRVGDRVVGIPPHW